jgi:hypothetical protein
MNSVDRLLHRRCLDRLTHYTSTIRIVEAGVLIALQTGVRGASTAPGLSRPPVVRGPDEVWEPILWPEHEGERVSAGDSTHTFVPPPILASAPPPMRGSEYERAITKRETQIYTDTELESASGLDSVSECDSETETNIAIKRIIIILKEQQRKRGE